MLETAPTESVFPHATNPLERGRRRSTFYVPLDATAIDANDSFCTELKRSLEKMYNPDLSACSFEWSLNDSEDLLVSNEPEPHQSVKRSMSSSSTQLNIDEVRTNKSKRYGIVLNGLNLDDDELQNNENDPGGSKSAATITSTPIKLMKSRSRSNILCLPEKSLQLSPLKEKSKTLPQNLSPKILSTAASSNALGNETTGHTSTFPPKYSFLLKSSPKISLNYSLDGGSLSPAQQPDKKGYAQSPVSSSPRKALSFIRRAHSTKLTRSNSLLKSLTAKCVDQNAELCGNQSVRELSFDRFEECFKSEQFYEQIKEIFVKDIAKDYQLQCASTSAVAIATATTKESTEKCDDEAHSGMESNIFVSQSFLFTFASLLSIQFSH